MKNKIKFVTPVAMKVTKEQYEKDLKNALKKLGYQDRIGKSLHRDDFIIYNYLSNCYNKDKIDYKIKGTKLPDLNNEVIKYYVSTKNNPPAPGPPTRFRLFFFLF